MCMQGEYENACKHQKHLMVIALHIFRVIELVFFLKIVLSSLKPA